MSAKKAVNHANGEMALGNALKGPYLTVCWNDKEKDLVNFWNHMVFHPTNAIEDDWGQAHLDKLAEGKAVQMVRIYAMFEECVTQGEKGELVFDFTKTDYRLDSLISRGFTPYIVYGFFPGFLSARTDDVVKKARYKNQVVYCSYPTDYSLWEEICRVYTQHIVDRYGEDTVATWHIHCFNEPDSGHFFYVDAPTLERRVEEYCKLYEGFVKGITSVSEKLMIGALGLSECDVHISFLRQFLDQVRERNLRLDFISYHSYGTSPGVMRNGENPLDATGAVYNTMQVKRVANLCGFGHLPMVCAEWGGATGGYVGVKDYGPRLLFRENELYALYFAKMLTACDEMGLCDPQFICMSGAHDLEEDFGGYRNFFSKSLYPKPIYNAYVLAARLGNEKLFHYGELQSEDLSVMATRHPDGHRSILLGYGDSNFARTLNPLALSMALDGLRGSWKVTGWRIDADHANAIRKFNELGQPQDPTEEQKAAIREFGSLKPEDLGTVSETDPVLNVRLENNTTMLLEFEAL